MPVLKNITSNSYAKLLASIRQQMARALRIVEQQKVVTYWATGQYIHEYIDANILYGGIIPFYNQLEQDLDINSRTLQQCEQFYRYFPEINLDDGLSWSHYRFLLAVPDKKKRDQWVVRVKKEGLPSNLLRLNLVEDLTSKSDRPLKEKLKGLTRGRLYLYRIVRMQDKKGASDMWYVDCGFTNRIEAPASSGVLDNKRLYISQKTPSGYRLKAVNALVEELYTFKASLIRVVDGDTIIAAIDQGFGVWTEQRLRLRGIDAPELKTLAGKKAKQFVEKCLKATAFIVVKTYKTDKYDRYLADIFYLPREEDRDKVAKQGRFLNQQLLDEGHAVLWKL